VLGFSLTEVLHCRLVSDGGGKGILTSLGVLLVLPAYRRALALLIAVTTVLVFASGCSEEAPPPEPSFRPIKTLTIGGTASGGLREYPGTIAAAQNAELSFGVAARLEAFDVKEGQEVEAGAILARLDDRDYQARLDSARADLTNAKTEHERYQKLFEEGVVPASERDARKTAYEVSEARFREAEKASEETILRAPFAGTVAKRLVDDFENVLAKQAILILQDDKGLEIKINIPERDAARGRSDREEMERRLRPRVVVTSLPDRELPARIQEFSTTADPATRTFEVTLTFDPPEDVRVFSGMTAKVVIDAQAEVAEGLTIPSGAALADEGGSAYVWLVEPGAMTVSRRQVELGELSGSEVSVLGGLAAGDEIAISGMHQLREGMAVRRLGE